PVSHRIWHRPSCRAYRGRATGTGPAAATGHRRERGPVLPRGGSSPVAAGPGGGRRGGFAGSYLASLSGSSEVSERYPASLRTKPTCSLAITRTYRNHGPAPSQQYVLLVP